MGKFPTASHLYPATPLLRPASGAIQTILKLLLKVDQRAAAITMLGKTVEMAKEKVSEDTWISWVTHMGHSHGSLHVGQDGIIWALVSIHPSSD